MKAAGHFRSSCWRGSNCLWSGSAKSDQGLHLAPKAKQISPRRLTTRLRELHANEGALLESSPFGLIQKRDPGCIISTPAACSGPKRNKKNRPARFKARGGLSVTKM